MKNNKSQYNPMNRLKKLQKAKNELKNKFWIFYRLENPNFDRLDAENAQFRRENRIPHANMCIYTAGNVIIPPTEWFLEDWYF